MKNIFIFVKFIVRQINKISLLDRIQVLINILMRSLLKCIKMEVVLIN